MNRHLNSEELGAWMIGEPTPRSQDHMADCEACRTEAGKLQGAFLQFRDSSRRWSEHHWNASRTMPRQSVGMVRRFAVAGGFTGLLLAGALLVVRPAPPARQELPFVAIPYEVPLAPYERTTVVRMEVSVEALMASGFDVHALEPGSAMAVDVLVGQDGRARAIRPIDRSVRQ